MVNPGVWAVERAEPFSSPTDGLPWQLVSCKSDGMSVHWSPKFALSESPLTQTGCLLKSNHFFFLYPVSNRPRKFHSNPSTTFGVILLRYTHRHINNDDCKILSVVGDKKVSTAFLRAAARAALFTMTVLSAIFMRFVETAYFIKAWL